MIALKLKSPRRATTSEIFRIHFLGCAYSVFDGENVEVHSMSNCTRFVFPNPKGDIRVLRGLVAAWSNGRFWPNPVVQDSIVGGQVEKSLTVSTGCCRPVPDVHCKRNVTTGMCRYLMAPDAFPSITSMGTVTVTMPGIAGSALKARRACRPYASPLVSLSSPTRQSCSRPSSL